MGIDESVYEIITQDLYFIASRIKEIDPSYFIVRNRKSGSYEVHSCAQKGGSYALTLPFDQLDARTLDYVRRTSSQRRDKLFAELEAHNAQAMKTMKDESVKTAQRHAEAALKEAKCS